MRLLYAPRSSDYDPKILTILDVWRDSIGFDAMGIELGEYSKFT